MSSLTDLPELVGFFSYSREDDDDSHGALSALRERIQRELRGQLGRTMKTFRLWQDKEAIAPGTLWAAEINTAVAQAVFFIPIITPTVVRSPYCKFELESFLTREAELGRSDLVFPILYIRVPELDDAARQQNDPVLSIIAKRQYLDWRELRHRDVHSTDVKEAVERFCAKICEALDRPKPPTTSRGAQHEPRAGSDQSRQDAGAKRGEERAARIAADKQAPSNRALFAGSLIGAAIIAAIGGWFVVAQTTLVAVAPTTPIVTAQQQVPSAPVTPAAPVPAAPAPAVPIESMPPAVAPAQPATAPTAAPIEPTPPAVAPEQSAVTSVPIVVTALSPDLERALKPKDKFKECSNCPEMVVVPAGAFSMGSPANELRRVDDEGPQHRVTFAHPFAVGEFALTFDEWGACVADGGCDGYRPSDQGWGRGRQPVINVSWDNAKAYVAWLAKKTGRPYRLLSEAEREYVTRAGTTTPFWWGSSISTSQANYDGKYTYGNGVKGEDRARTLPVDSFAPNPWGLYQVHGNVDEWTEDCYHESYQGAPSNGAAWTQGGGHFPGEPSMILGCSFRVPRGGSWKGSPDYLRSAYRDRITPAKIQDGSVGFRVGRTLVTP